MPLDNLVSMQNIFWRGASVAITGITGSLGTALSKELLKSEYNISRLVGISRKWQDQDRLREELNDDRLRLFVGDVRDIDRLKLALEGVEYVFHAAALKSVPIAFYNPTEAISVNITGTINVLQASRDVGVRRVVVVSSDKAVQPASENLYGVTKAAAECLAVAYNSYSAGRQTRYCAARWGNVLGSSGSVVPLFMKQRENGKLTITHDKMTRFWVTMDEVVHFILRVMESMIGGEIFVPHLPSSRVTTLASAIAPDAEFETVGMRPGEKMHEVLLSPEESPRTKDLGWAYRVEPTSRPWGGVPYAGGSPVPSDWIYSSASAERLGESELRNMLFKFE